MLAAGRDNTDSAGEGADHEKTPSILTEAALKMASSITTNITEKII